MQSLPFVKLVYAGPNELFISCHHLPKKGDRLRLDDDRLEDCEVEAVTWQIEKTPAGDDQLMPVIKLEVHL